MLSRCRRIKNAALIMATLLLPAVVVSPPPAQAAVGKFREYPGVSARTITLGPDGNMWATDGGSISRITPSGNVTRFDVSTVGPLRGIARGPDDNIWFTESGGDPDLNETGAARVGRITLDGAVTKWNVPTAGSHPRNITTGPDGNLWFSTYYGVARVTPVARSIGGVSIPAGTVTEYPIVPPPADCRRAGVFVNSCPGAGDIVAAPDGHIWFNGTRRTGGTQISRINPTTSLITTYPAPLTPIGLAVGPDANVWFTAEKNIGRMTTGCVPASGSSEPVCTGAAGVVTTFPRNDNEGAATDITTGPDGNLWYVTLPATTSRGGPGDGGQVGNKVGRMTTNGAMTEFAIPSPNNNSQSITPGPDGSGDLWYGGTVVGRINAVPVGDRYTAVAPSRICDTRNESFVPDEDQCKGGRLDLNDTDPENDVLTIDVAGKGGIPASGVTGVVLNVTATGATEESYLTVYPAGAERPVHSNLNFLPAKDVANLVQVELSPDGKVSIFNNAGAVDVVVDVEGYFSDSEAHAGLFVPLVPKRICDSRTASYAGVNQCSGRPLSEQTASDIQVTGLGGVPASGVAAVVLNITAANPTAQSFLTVYPTGAVRPTASNLNFEAGQDRANRVEVPVGAGGRVTIYNEAGVTDVIVDVGGYITDDTAEPLPVGAAAFTGITPVRICDTRDFTYLDPSNNECKGNTLGWDSTLEITVAGKPGLPPVGVPTAVVLNVTTVDQTLPSFMSVYPADVFRPGVSELISDLNWQSYTTTANLVVVKLSQLGAIKAYNFRGDTDVVVDVLGWYS